MMHFTFGATGFDFFFLLFENQLLSFMALKIKKGAVIPMQLFE